MTSIESWFSLKGIKKIEVIESKLKRIVKGGFLLKKFPTYPRRCITATPIMNELKLPLINTRAALVAGWMEKPSLGVWCIKKFKQKSSGCSLK